MQANSFGRAAPANGHHPVPQIRSSGWMSPLLPLLPLCLVVAGCQPRTNTPTPPARPSATTQPSAMLYVESDDLAGPHEGTRAYSVSMMPAPPPATAMQPVFQVESSFFPYLGFVRSA
jgi:hypothetical protein